MENTHYIFGPEVYSKILHQHFLRRLVSGGDFQNVIARWNSEV